MVATQNYDDLFSDVEKFRYDNIIPSVTGRYVELENFEEDFAQIGHLQRQISYHYIEDDFVLKARIEWNTAIETSDPSGCGLIFAAERRKGKDHEYVVVLDRSRIYFGELHVAGYYELGKSRGTGRLNIGNPASAEFTLLVYDYKAYVYVDGEFIGEYALSKDHKIKGRMGYVIFSGTNRDYGTHCKISNAGMWIFEK